MASIFTLWGEIAIKADEADKTIDNTNKKAKDLGGTIESTGSRFSNTVTTKMIAKAQVLGNVITSVASKLGHFAVQLGMDAINAAASMEAETAQFTSSFGNLADEATNAFKIIQKDTNIFAGRLKSTGTKAFNQFRGSGIEATEALIMMDEYLRLTADAAAFYDISLEDADERMRSFLRGNTEAGDAIGLFTSELQRDNYALELYGIKWLDLNEAQRQMLMLNVASDIYEQSGAMGQAAREGHSWSNAMGNLSRAWQEVLGKLGGPIMNALLPQIERLSKWLTENPEKVEGFANAIGDIAGVTIDGLISGLEWIVNNSEQIAATISNIGGAVKNLFGMGDGGGVLDNPNNPYGNNYRGAGARTGVGVNEGIDGLYGGGGASFGIPLTVSEESKGEMQSAIDGMSLDGRAKIEADPSSEAAIQNDLNGMNLEATVTLKPKGGGILSGIRSFFGFGADGSHASGLDRVPFDSYRAILHKDEAVLNASEAAVWRGEQQQNRSSYANRYRATQSDQPITVNVNVSGQTKDPYELASEVRNALELMRWGMA